MSRRRKRSGRTGTRSIPRRIEELGLSSYREYLASAHWKELKARFTASKLVSRDEAGRLQCAVCLRSNLRLSVHHRTYKRLGREWLMDLMMACDDCHKRIHEFAAAGNLWKATKMMQKTRGQPTYFRQEETVSTDEGNPPW
jgi:5-methylcytosine-specific restriction endonuclease McrA